MKNLITITPEKNAQGKTIITSELTIDGATKLNEANSSKSDISFADFYDNSWSKKDGEGKLIFSEDGKTIFSQIDIPFEKDPFVTAEYKTDANIFEKWAKDPKEKIVFTPVRDNQEKGKEAKAKVAAGMWAVYSNQKLCEAAIETNKRYATIRKVFSKIMDAAMTFKYDGFSQDDKYYETIKQCSEDMEKEMDFCIQKMRVMTVITENDFNLSTPVNELYRKFRGIDEQENKSKINVTHNEDDQENEADNNPEGESNLRVV